jgi:outer membrane protein TolC
MTGRRLRLALLTFAAAASALNGGAFAAPKQQPAEKPAAEKPVEKAPAAEASVLDSIPAGSKLLEAPPGIFVIDAGALKRERLDNAVMEKARTQLLEAGSGALFAPAHTAEAPLREVLLSALKRNLTIRRSGLSRDISERALSEAQAVFDPVFIAAVSTTENANFSRTEYAMRFKPDTEFVPINQFDKRGGFYCQPNSAALTVVLDPADAAISPEGGCYIVPFTSTRSPVQTVQYDRKRTRGDYPSSVKASDPDKFSPRRQRTSFGSATIAQRLPWGVQTQTQFKLTHKETYFKLNEVSALPSSWGEYGRPWTSSITTTTAIPLPGSKNFGPYADADFSVAVRRVAVEAADFDARAIINGTLQQVETVFWTEVGAILNLNAAVEAVDQVRGMADGLRQIYEDGYVTTSNMGQIEAQLAALETVRDREYGRVLSSSERLREMLDDGEDRLLLPLGWRRLLESKIPEPALSIDRVLEHPSYRRAAISVRMAEMGLRQKQAQTRPDVALTLTNRFDQSNAVFGYKTIGESVRESINPDNVTHTVTLAGSRPLGNRAAKAAVVEAESIIRQQRLTQERVGKQLEEDYEIARISLSSARHRLDLARNSLRLADAAYESSLRLMNEGLLAAYETLGRLQSRLDARIAFHAALIDARLAEVRMYSALGLLAERAGERTAVTAGDRQRLTLLRESGQFRHFSGGGGE